MKQYYFLFLVSILSLCNLQSQELISFSALNNTNCSNNGNPVFSDPNVSGSGICRGPGVNYDSGSTYTTDSWPTGGLSTSDYLEWTVQANSGYLLDLSNIRLRYGSDDNFAGSDGPSQLSLRVDYGTGFNQIYYDGSVSDTPAGETTSLIALTSIPITANTVTFRLYAFSASGFDGDGDFEILPITANKGIQIFGNAIDPSCSELFISEYIEGSSFNKYIEIYNPTNASVNMSNYRVAKYTNGSSTVTGTPPTLTGTLAPFSTYVIGNNNTGLYTSCDFISTYYDFNGDDAIALQTSAGANIDVIGQIGLDPGSEWSGTSCSQGTQNGTLVRNSTIQFGDVNGSDAFNPDIEWTCYATDDISNLGSHTSDCQAPSTELQLVDNTATNQNCGYTIDFGSVANDGSTTDLTFDITNIGSLDLNVSSFNITGDYSIVSPATPFTVTTGNSQTVTVRFAPTTDGTLTGILTINNNDLDEGSCDVNLTGVGFTPGPNINVRGVVGSIPTIPNGSTTTSPLNNTQFAQQTISTTQQTKTFRIGNEGGTADLTVSGITLTGDTADFIVTSSFTNPFAPNTSQDFDITFQPTTLSGLRSVTVSIANSDPNKNPYTFVVEGNAICPSVSGTISPTEGPAGTTVTVLSPGNDLTGATAELNGVALTTVSSDNLELVVRLPNTITTGGPLSVQLTNGCIFSETFTLIDQTIAGCDTSSSATVGNLFISEVTDSPTGSLTYIELYNATGSTINFASDTHRVRIYNNGNTSTTYELVLNSGTVANNSTYVISCGVTSTQCPVSGGDGSLAQANLSAVGASINFFRNSSGVDDPTIGHDYIGLYADAAIISDPMDPSYNPDGNIDSWGIFGDQTWATGLGLGLKGANFERDTSAPMIPNTTFSTSDWIITDWNDSDCSDVDYSTIGAYDFSTGVPPTVTVQPTDPAFACAFSASISITGVEGYNGPTPPDTQELAYQWYFNAPGDATWTEILLANTNYSGQQSATLNIIDTSNLDGYQYYCQLREDSNTCFEASNAVILSVLKSVWGGTNWSDAPAMDRIAIINADYDTSVGTNGETSFEACECTVNNGSTLTIANGDYVRVDHNVINNGTIDIASEGSLVQVNDLGTYTLNPTTGTNILSKQTSFLQNWYEYTYWSSPLQSAQIETALFDSNPVRRYFFDASQFNDVLVETNNTGTFIGGNDDIDDDGNDWNLQTTGSMVVGRGYATMHNSLAFTPNNYTYIIEGNPSNGQGGFNTGDISIDIYIRPEVVPVTSAQNYNNWNFIGNPYPSAINATTFFEDTSSFLEGVIYLWSHVSDADFNSPGNENANFSQDDYAVLNYVGGVATGSSAPNDPGNTPNGFIASCQGFFVIGKKSHATSGAGYYNEVVFNNRMRVTGNNNQFYRNAIQSDTSNKLWLNLTSNTGLFSQILVGYVDGASNDIDAMAFDAPRNLSTGTTAVLSSIISNSDKKFAIQAKHPNSLSLDEIIPLGFYTSIDEPLLYTLSVAQTEGDFMSANTIYLIDRLNNNIHNLSASNYSFTSETGEFNERFDIVFRADALSVDDNLLDANDLTIIELTNGDVKFSVGKAFTIAQVEILDVLGRRIYSLQGNSSTEVYDLSNLGNAAYIAKVRLSNGQTITKKAIKRK